MGLYYPLSFKRFSSWTVDGLKNVSIFFLFCFFSSSMFEQNRRKAKSERKKGSRRREITWEEQLKEEVGEKVLPKSQGIRRKSWIIHCMRNQSFWRRTD